MHSKHFSTDSNDGWAPAGNAGHRSPVAVRQEEYRRVCDRLDAALTAGHPIRFGLIQIRGGGVIGGYHESFAPETNWMIG